MSRKQSSQIEGARDPYRAAEGPLPEPRAHRMPPRQNKQIQELIDLLKRNQLTELEIERGGIRIRVRHEIGVKTVSASMTEQGLSTTPALSQPTISRQCAGRGRHRSDHDHVADRRHVLSFPFARCRPLCRRRGLREKRAGLVHRRSNEADERDRVGGGRANHENPGGKHQACGIWPGSLSDRSQSHALTPPSLTHIGVGRV